MDLQQYFKIKSNILKDGYFFDSTKMLLTLNAGSLQLVSNRQYEIRISTVYFDTEYYQKVRITIDNIQQVPISIIKLNYFYFKFMIPNSTYCFSVCNCIHVVPLVPPSVPA